jgi:hypothetical protein
MTPGSANKLAFLLSATDKMSRVLQSAANNANRAFTKIESDIAKFGQKALNVSVPLKAMGDQITGSIFNIVKEAANRCP